MVRELTAPQAIFHARRLAPDKYRLVSQLLAISVSPDWSHLVLRVLNATGPGQGVKAAEVGRLKE